MTGTRSTQRIVVGIDGSEPSKVALRWAIEQARLTGDVVEAVMAWEFPIGYDWAPIVDPDDLAKAAEQTLADTVAEVAGTNPPATVTTRVVQGHPAYALIEDADDARLLVVGCRGHGGFVNALLGSVSQYCVQHATCPVVVIRGPQH